MKGRIIQDARLFLQKEGEAKMRWVKTWKIYKAVCKALGISTDYSKRTFLEPKDMPAEGRIIKEWPEKDPKVGPIRLMFNVGPSDDFQKIKDLGITDILYYSIYWEGDDGRSYLDKAKKHSLGVAYSLEGPIRDQVMQGRPWEREGVDRAVRLCNEHPAASIIEVIDEPDMAYYDPKRLINKKTQREICDFIRARTNKPLMVMLSGGVSPGWDIVDLSLWDIIGIDHYCWDGTGEIWGEVPLEYFDRCCKKAADYLKEKYPDQLDKLIYIFQCCMVPAEDIDPHKPLPEGIIQQQFDAALKYNLFPAGLSLWGWNGGYYGPKTSNVMYQEVKNLLDKIKEG